MCRFNKWTWGTDKSQSQVEYRSLQWHYKVHFDKSRGVGAAAFKFRFIGFYKCDGALHN